MDNCSTSHYALFESLSMVVYRRDIQGQFTLVSESTDWLAKVLEQNDAVDTDDITSALPFLEWFTVGAVEHWKLGANGTLCSEDWEESFPDGTVVALVARAVCHEQEQLLILEYLGDRYERTKQVHQTAREMLLTGEHLERVIARRTQKIRQREEEISMRLLSATNMRDQETGSHVRRIGLYAAVIGRGLGWSSDQVEDILISAPMHDIGKIGIPDHILMKPGRLTVAEFQIMQQHAKIGADMLSGSDIPLLETAREIALSHHERWDGQGYPDGLSGENIPVSARVVTVCDVYDALTHSRVYKRAFTHEETIEMMLEQRGKHFDPTVLDCFLEHVDEIIKIRTEVNDGPSEVHTLQEFTGTFG